MGFLDQTGLADVWQRVKAHVSKKAVPEDVMLAVWHDYISQATARGDKIIDGQTVYGNGTTSGNGRTVHFYTSRDGLGFTEINRGIYPLNRTDYQHSQNVGASTINYWNGKYVLTTTGRWHNASDEVDPAYDGVIGVSEDLVHWRWVPFRTGLNQDGNHTGGTGDAFNALSSVALKCTVIDGKLWCTATITMPLVQGSTTESDWKGTTVHGIQYAIQRSWYAQITSIDDEVVFWQNGMIPLTHGIIDESSTAIGTGGITYHDRIATIDPIFFEYNGRMMLLLKNEATLRIELYRLADGGDLETTDPVVRESNTWERLNDNVFWTGTEAPAVAYFGGKWHLYADSYNSVFNGPRGIYHCTTVDFETYTDYHRIYARTDYSIHHGGIMTVSAEAAKAILRDVPDFSTGGVTAIPGNQAYLLTRTKGAHASGSTLTIDTLEVVPDTDYYISSGYDQIVITNLVNKSGVDHLRFVWVTAATTLTITNSLYGPDDASPLAISFSDVPQALSGGGRYVRDFDVCLTRDALTYMMNAGNNSPLEKRLRPLTAAGDAGGSASDITRVIAHGITAESTTDLYELGMVPATGLWLLVINASSPTINNSTSVYTIRRVVSGGNVRWSSWAPIYEGTHARAPRLDSSGVLTCNSYIPGEGESAVDMRITIIPMIAE